MSGPKKKTAVKVPRASADILRRIVYTPDRVPHDGGCGLITKLTDMEQRGIAPILMLVSSDGGDRGSGLATIDWIRLLRSPVYTLALGRALSCGALLLLAGERRYITPHAKVLVHSIRGCISGDYQALDMQYRDRSRVQDRMERYIAERTGLSLRRVRAMMKNERYLDAQEAVDLGFAERIVTDIREIEE